MAANSQAESSKIPPKSTSKTNTDAEKVCAESGAEADFSRCMELLSGEEEPRIREAYLSLAGNKGGPSRQGGYMRRGKCLCPVHETEGSTPSLSIAVKAGKGEGARPVLLAKCFAGCDQRLVWEALKRLLRGEKVEAVEQGKGGAAAGSKKKKSGTKGLKQLVEKNLAYKKEAGAWIYRDASGKPVSIKKKFLVIERAVDGVAEEKVLGKDYWRGHAVFKEDGEFLEWKSGVTGFASEILYNLPVLMAAQARGLPVVICEGEKDCDTVYREFKVASTTNANGAGVWTEQDTDVVLGSWQGKEGSAGRREILILQDNDEPGRKSGLYKALCLWEEAQERGLNVRIRLLPCFHGEGGVDASKDTGFDVTDWFEAGLGSKESFLACARACVPFDPTDLDDPEPWLAVKNERAHRKVSKAALEARVAQRLVSRAFIPDVETEQSFGERYTDKLYTKHLVEDYSGFAGYCPGKKSWTRYVDGVWDTSGEEVEGVAIISDLSSRMLEEARGRRIDPGNEEQVKRKQEALKAALKISDMSGVSNLLKYASRTRQMLKPLELFDTQVDLLNLRSGELELKRAQLLAHEPKNYHSKQLDIGFNSKAQCPKWEAFITQTFIVKKDPMNPSQALSNIDEEKTRELIGFVRRLCGYCLTGYVTEQRFIILQGIGSNGKSVFINVLMNLMGEGELGYAASIPVGTILKNSFGSSGGEAATPQLVKLVGKRVVTAGELSEGDLLNDSLLKDWTGGDPVTGRALRQAPITFKPQFKLFLRCNPLPRIPASDSALWRRIIVVPFVNLVTADEINPRLEQELLEEREGILRWCAEGAVEWYRVGLQIPAACVDFVEEYASDMDWAQQFVSEVCVVQPGAVTPRDSLYKAYAVWIDGRGEKPKSQRVFAQEMKRMGYAREKDAIRLEGATKTCRVFNGLMLDPTWGDVDDESPEDLLKK